MIPDSSSSTFRTMSAHSSRLLNGITSVQVQVGAGSSFNVTSVRIQRVPSEPMIRSFTSYPVVFFTTLDEKFMIDPSGITASMQRTKSLVSPQMAYIPDEPFYFLQADTLEMMRYFRGMYESFDEKMFYRLQEFFPGIDMKRNIRRLSKGMQKQVAFWLALCCRPKLLILDEPLDGLDPVMRKQIWTILMSEVAERRTTVLVSSHNLRELEDVCDHVGIMNHGKVIIERSLFDLHGNISKIQVACQTGMPKLPKEFEVLHMSNSGRVYTMIVKGNPREVAAAIQTEGDHLAIVDILPLTLEEIFIYEMGGLGYEVKDILF